jgi:hypothetical protein
MALSQNDRLRNALVDAAQQWIRIEAGGGFEGKTVDGPGVYEFEVLVPEMHKGELQFVSHIVSVTEGEPRGA